MRYSCKRAADLPELIQLVLDGEELRSIVRQLTAKSVWLEFVRGQSAAGDRDRFGDRRHAVHVHEQGARCFAQIGGS